MSLAMSVWIDRTNVRPGQRERAHLVVELVATGSPRERRGASATVLAIDVSGSMQGEPLAQVARSVDRLLEAFREGDQVGVVAFSDEAATVVPLVPIDDASKRLIRQRVGRLASEHNTNIEAGLAEAGLVLGASASAGVVLLSDGVPNRGATTIEAISDVVKRYRPRASFSSLGYGANHSEDVLCAVADAGGGTYAFVSDPALCARAFARAVGAQADVVASGIELVIGLGEDVELLGFVGREETKITKEGVSVMVSDMMDAARRVIVCEVAVRGSPSAFFADVATLRLRSTEGAVDEVVKIEVADREPRLLPEALARAMLAHADVARSEARTLADQAQFGGAAARLRAMLARIHAVPGFTVGESTPLGEAYEVLVDEAAAMERRPDAEAYGAFRKAAVGSRLAAPSSRAVGGESSRMLEATAGRVPVAWLVANGERHRLRHECTIGRTASSDLALADPSVAKRHAEVFVMDGSFFLQDLGSTNPTSHNGERVTSVPVRLAHGDVLRLGEVEIRFDEGER